MIGLKTKAFEGFFLSTYSALETAGEVITEATLAGLKPVARISDVGRCTETVPVFQHVSSFNNNKSKTTTLFYHENTEVTS